MTTNYICFLNNKEVEIDLSFEIVKSISDYKSLEARGTTSKGLTFPSTPINDVAFGLLYDLNSYNNYDTTKKVDIIIQADNTIIIDGYFELTNITLENDKPISYEGTAYSDNSLLFTLIKDKDMSELDLSELNFTLTDDFVYDTYYYEQYGTNFNADIYTNIAFPWIDYGKGVRGWRGDVIPTGSYGYGCDDVYPGIYSKYLLDKIFAEAGCSYESSFLDSTEFSNFITTFNQDLDIFSTGMTSVVMTGATAFAFDLNKFNHGLSPLPTDTYIAFQSPLVGYLSAHTYSNIIPLGLEEGLYNNSKYITEGIGGTNQFNIIDLDIGYNSSIYFKKDCNITLSYTIQLELDHVPTQLDFNRIYVCKNKFDDFITIDNTAQDFKLDSSEEWLNLNDNDGFFITGTSMSISFTKTYDVEENDFIYLRFLYPVNSSNITTGKLEGTIEVTNFQMSINKEYQVGVDVDMNRFWLDKNFKQADYIGDIVKMFNLQIYPDKFYNKHYHLEPYSSFISTDDALILEPDETLEQIEFINNYKSYNFSYAEDKDHYSQLFKKTFNKEYGSYIIDTENELTDEEAELKLDIFSSAPLSHTPGFNFIVSGTNFYDIILTKLYEGDGVLGQQKRIEYNRYTKTEYNPRMLYFDMTKSAYSNHYFRFRSTFFNFPCPSHLSPNQHGCYRSGTTRVELTPRYDYNFDTDNIGCNTVYPISNDNLYNRFYGKYINEIGSSNTKLYKAKFNLTPSDVNMLELNRLVYIETKGYFLIQELRYTPEALTELDLIKLDNVEYTYSKYKKPMIPAHNWSFPQAFNNNVVPQPDPGTVIGINNINITSVSTEWTGTTTTYWIDGSGTTGSTFFPGSVSSTTSDYQPISSVYQTTDRGNTIIGNNNILKNTTGDFVQGDSNSVRNSTNVSLLGSYEVNISGVTGVVAIGVSNSSIYNSNSIYLGNSSTTIYIGNDTLSSYILSVSSGGTSGSTSPGGLNKSVQFNSGGTFQGGKLLWDYDNNSLYIDNNNRNNNFGYLAGYTVSGSGNTNIGYASGIKNGNDNISIGEVSNFGGSGNSNIVMGKYSLKAAYGDFNVVVGEDSMYHEYDYQYATGNTVIGHKNLYILEPVDCDLYNNVILGYNNGDINITSCYNNIIIGNNQVFGDYDLMIDNVYRMGKPFISGNLNEQQGLSLDISCYSGATLTSQYTFNTGGFITPANKYIYLGQIGVSGTLRMSNSGGTFLFEVYSGASWITRGVI